MEALTLLPFKEMSTCRPKYSYDHQFFINVLSSLEGQEGFTREGDRARADKTIQLLRGISEGGNVIPHETFFERLTEIFPPNIGLNEGGDDAHLATAAFHAKELSGPRGAPSRISKENTNPQYGSGNFSGKRKIPVEETSVELKTLQDLKSEFGNMRAQLQAMCDHFGITCKKRKTQDEQPKQAKAHAGLASSNAGKGKSQKQGKTPVATFPR